MNEINDRLDGLSPEKRREPVGRGLAAKLRAHLHKAEETWLLVEISSLESPSPSMKGS